MQKEIKKRMKLYGLAAILLAIIMVSICYQFGYIPQLPLPQTSSSALMSTFSSYDELRDFLKNRTKNQYTYTYENFNLRIAAPTSPWLSTSTDAALNAPSTFAGAVPIEIPQHSTTNIQVAGVDEADFVKTDDNGYIYVMTNNNVSILKGYPPEEAQLITTIAFGDMTPVGIFVSGDRLVVLGSKYNAPQAIQFPYYYTRSSYYGESTTYAKVYDVSDRSHPELLRTYSTSGGYFSSRMIGEYVYFVSSQQAYYTFEIMPNVIIDRVNLPKVQLDDNGKEVAASEIQYSNTTDDNFWFTTIGALNIQNIAENPTYKTLMIGGASTVYVSLHDIFMTFQGFDQTSIYRVHIENTTISPETVGEVPGHVLNQYSMDQYGDYFRIATSTWMNGTQHNVYVLDTNMSIVGRLEGLAPGENLHSARFVENKCYLVTFVQTDPLFVINLTDPTQPEVLGELKIPGYSDYLHPYDENHLIGVGKETVNAWYQGIKVALFDVSDVNNPIQEANYTIGDRGSESPVLSDPKAFLFDKSKNLLVIPVLVAEIKPSQYPGEVPTWVRGQPVWQGACVFNLTLDGGFAYRGGISHIENIADIWDNRYYVQRSLYIENVLYTVSAAEVKLNDLDDLTFIKEIKLG